MTRATSRKSRRWRLAAMASLAVSAGIFGWIAHGTGAATTSAAAEHVSEPAPAAAAPSRAAGREVAPAPSPPAAPPAQAPDEEQIARLRAEVDQDPAVAVQLAEEDERRLPDGPHAAERSFLKMRALVHLGDIVAARDEAREFFVRHPHDPFGESVWRLTGMRPRPSPFPQ